MSQISNLIMRLGRVHFWVRNAAGGVSHLVGRGIVGIDGLRRVFEVDSLEVGYGRTV